MEILNNFALSQFIIPRIVEGMLANDIELKVFSNIEFISNNVDSHTTMTFEWSDIYVSYTSLDTRYSMTFIIFSQPEKSAQAKYGIIIEDKKSKSDSTKLTYFTLEQSISFLEAKTIWMICSPKQDGNHHNFGVLENAPTPYNFVERCLKLQNVVISSKKNIFGRLFSLNTADIPAILTFNTCIISEKACSKMLKVQNELHNRYVNIGVMMGHKLDNGIVLIIDCFFCKPRRIEDGFGYDYNWLNRNVQDICYSYRQPLSYIGFIHSQPSDYLSNMDEITAINSTDVNNSTSFLGIISSANEDKIQIFEFHQQPIQKTNSKIWDYTPMQIEVDNSTDKLIPQKYLLTDN